MLHLSSNPNSFSCPGHFFAYGRLQCFSTWVSPVYLFWTSPCLSKNHFVPRLGGPNSCFLSGGMGVFHTYFANIRETEEMKLVMFHICPNWLTFMYHANIMQ